MASSIQVDETLRLVRVDIGRPLTSLICAAAVDQRTLVLGTADGLVHVARLDGPTRTYALTAPDGLQRRSPITMIRTCGGLIFLVHSPSNRILQIEKSFDETIKSIRFKDDTIMSFDIDDSGLLVAGDANGCVFAWNCGETRPVSLIYSENEPIAAVVLESSQQLAIFATGSGRIFGYDIKANAIAASIDYKFRASMAAIWYGHHGAAIADSSGQVLAVGINESRFEQIHEWAETAVVVSIAVHKSGQYVALGMTNGHVVVRSLDDVSVIFGQYSMRSAVIAVEFIDQGEKSPRLLVASYCGSLQIWPISVSGDSEPNDSAETTDAHGDATTSKVEDGIPTTAFENQVAPSEPILNRDASISGEIPVCSESLSKVPNDADPFDSVASRIPKENIDDDGDDFMQPRSGPVPTPEPPVPVDKELQSESFKAQSHALPEVGLTAVDNEEISEPKNIAVLPKSIEPCPLLTVAPSIRIGKFSSKLKIDSVLNRSSRLPSDSVLATPLLNSTNWIQHKIDQLATSALTEPPDIDLRVVTERAASKALYVDPTKTGVFGELPSIDVELPPPSRPQIQKQVDPKWVRSLDRKPIMDVLLNKEDLEPQIPGHDSNWSLSSSSHQRSSTDNTDVTAQMGSLLMRRISYWQRGTI